MLNFFADRRTGQKLYPSNLLIRGHKTETSLQPKKKKKCLKENLECRRQSRECCIVFFLNHSPYTNLLQINIMFQRDSVSNSIYDRNSGKANPNIT
jgi:hypothetical protein